VLGLGLVLALAARVARRDGIPLRPSVRLLPWVWAGAVPLLYMVGGVPVLARYLLPRLPVFAWLAWRELGPWLGARAPPGRGVGGRRRTGRRGPRVVRAVPWPSRSSRSPSSRTSWSSRASSAPKSTRSAPACRQASSRGGGGSRPMPRGTR